MGSYIKLANVKDIPKNTMKVFKVNDIEVLIVNVDDEFYALENRCPHMGYPLYFGTLQGEVITCGFHYEKFNVKTGKPSGNVTQKPLKTFKTRIQGSTILVETNSKG